MVRAKGILKGVNKDQMFESLKNGGIEERRKVSAELVVSLFPFFQIHRDQLLKIIN